MAYARTITGELVTIDRLMFAVSRVKGERYRWSVACIGPHGSFTIQPLAKSEQDARQKAVDHYHERFGE